MRYDDLDAPRVPDDRLRVGDADRERVAERVRQAHAEGRLGPEELGERIERCCGRGRSATCSG
jgi:hypothetical protein